ncbi:AraC family transcriptional regulator [Chryseobacterium wangxinyae]|uniref:AraC family transcriptional regulator n=1 Tax=Chryseobacterium sp. CY353 TaxID=2997334 RepID=UPI00226FCEF1|nr:AraC family transcriptional regulator [Chryseobacterium sp. CY353]MCY0969626.1 helix-turn-helix domain-containing protein [Chryseobacterium sp. CY353]
MKCLLIFLCLMCHIAYSQQNDEKISGNSIVVVDVKKVTENARKLSSENPYETIKLAKTAYRNSKQINYGEGILESNDLIMTGYYDMGRYKDVIKQGTEAEKYAQEIEDQENLSGIHLLLGLSYNELGFSDESLKHLKKALEATDKINSKNGKLYKKSLINNGLASRLLQVKGSGDSVVYYQNKSLENIQNINNDKEYFERKNSALALIYLNFGKANNLLHKTNDSEKYFLKSLDILQDKNYRGNKLLEVSVYNELSRLYYGQKEDEQSLFYAEKAEILGKQISSPYLRRDIYKSLVESNLAILRGESDARYMDLFIKLNDSIENSEYSSINALAKTLTEKQASDNLRDNRKLGLIIVAGLFFLTLLTCFFYIRNQDKLHEKYQTAIRNLESEKTDSNKSYIRNPTDKNLIITDHTAHILLEKLNKFEQSKKFLQKDVTRVYLANLLHTNTKYLSEIIRLHTGKNFNNYINGLRIQYIVEKLNEDPKYREYKISYLAEESGFASREIFAITFKREMEVSPSYFISNLLDGKKGN